MQGIGRWLVLWLLLGSAAVGAQPGPEVQVAFMRFPGYAELDESGRAVGKAVDLVAKLVDEAGYGARVRILPAARIWQGLETGDIHIWPGVLSKPGLDEHTLLTQRDLGRVMINLYYLSGEPEPAWPQGLRGKSLIMITNFTYTTELERMLADPQLQLTLLQSNSHRGALQMLLRGRGDYLLDYGAQVDAVQAELGLAALPFVQVAEQPMRLVLSRHTAIAEQLRDDLDAAFDRLHAQGEELDVTLQ